MIDDKIKMRRDFLMGFCSLQVVNTVLFNRDFPDKKKQELLNKAKEFAKADDRSRVYIADWEKAVRESK